MSISTYAELRAAVSNYLKRGTTTVSDERLKEFVTLAEDRIYTDARIRAMEAHADLVMKKTIDFDASEVSESGTLATMTPATAVTSYTYGDRYRHVVETTNTAAQNINISALGEKDVKKVEGDDGTLLELEASDWKAGATVEYVYDGTQFIWVPRGGMPLPSRYIAQRRNYINMNRTRLEFMTPEQFWDRVAISETAAPNFYTIEGGLIIFAPVFDTTYDVKFLYFRKLAAFSSDSDTNWLLTNGPGVYLYATLLEAFLYLANDSRALTMATAYDERIEKHNMTSQEGRVPRGRTRSLSEVPVV